MENLFDQVYKNGFVVNEEKPVYINLDTNIKLMTNIDRAQNDYNDNPNKLYNIDKVYGFQTSIPQLQYSKVKEANNLIEKNEPKIKHQEIKEYEDMRRINLQIQNRLNERVINQIDTSYAPQGLTQNQIISMSSTKPKLQNEIQAIEEYARTHFLSADQTKKLKEELIKKNYRQWVNNIEGVKRSRDGNKPLSEAIEEVKEEEIMEQLGDTSHNVLQALMTLITNNIVNENEPIETKTKTNEPLTVIEPNVEDNTIYEDFTEDMEIDNATEPITAKGTPTPLRQPRIKSPIRQPVFSPKGDERLVIPTNPTQITAQERIQDKKDYPLDYPIIDGGKSLVNINVIPNNNDIIILKNNYFTNSFLNAFDKGTSIKTLQTGRNFLSLFQENTEEGRQYIENKFYDKKFNFSKYIQVWFTLLNVLYKNTMSADQLFFSINTFKNGNLTGITLPESPLQKRIFLKVLLEFLSACRKVLLNNLELLKMTINKDNNISFSSIEKMKELKKIVMDKTLVSSMINLSNNPTTTPSPITQSPSPITPPSPPVQQRRPPKITEDKPIEKSKEDKKMLKTLNKQIDYIKRIKTIEDTIKYLKEEIELMDNNKASGDGRKYGEKRQEKHKKDKKTLQKLQKEKLDLEKKLSKIADNAIAGSGGGVITGIDGKEIVIN